MVVDRKHMPDKGASPGLSRTAVDLGVRYRYRIRAAIDLVLVAMAVVAAVLLRYDFSVTAPDWGRVVALIPVVCMVQLAVGILSAEGIEVDIANNGLEAVAMAS